MLGWVSHFAYNYLLYMGFYNFQLSISFFFFSFGLWWKHKDDMQIRHLVVLYLLLLLTYLSHIASYGLIVLGISLAAGIYMGRESVSIGVARTTCRMVPRVYHPSQTAFLLLSLHGADVFCANGVLPTKPKTASRR